MNAIEELLAAAQDIPIEFDFHGNPATPEWQRFINALEAAESMQPMAVPDGWVPVPIQATMAMLQAGSAAADGLGSPLTRTECAWNAMLAAAPSRGG